MEFLNFINWIVNVWPKSECCTKLHRGVYAISRFINVRRIEGEVFQVPAGDT